MADLIPVLSNNINLWSTVHLLESLEIFQTPHLLPTCKLMSNRDVSESTTVADLLVVQLQWRCRGESIDGNKHFGVSLPVM